MRNQSKISTTARRDSTNTLAISLLSLSLLLVIHDSKLYHLQSIDSRGLRDPHHIESCQDQAQVMLGDHIRHNFRDQKQRFGKLILLLPAMRGISTKTLEDVFFRQTIGPVSIETLLADLFKSS